MKAIMYHYVRFPSEELPNLRFLHVDDFKKQLDYFQNNYGIINARDFARCVDKADASSSAVILTFDDGLKDHYRYVFPELVKRKITAFFYVPTGIFYSNCLLAVHRIHMLLGKYGGKIIYEAMNRHINTSIIDMDHIEEFKKNTYRTQNNDWYTNEVKRFFNFYIKYERQNEVLGRLMVEYFSNEASMATDFYLNENEIREMSAAGMVFGSHTVHHYLLSKCISSVQDEEITGSFKQLPTINSDNSIKTFCYPYGGLQSYTDETVAILYNSKVDFAFSVEQRDIDTNALSNNRLYLPRYDCNYFPYGKAWTA